MSNFAHILSQLQLFILRSVNPFRPISDFSLLINFQFRAVHFKPIPFVYPVPKWHIVLSFYHMGWLILTLLDHCQRTVGEAWPLLTFIHDVLIPVDGLGGVDWPDHTLVAQVAHEKLETNEGKDTQAEDGQDHHIRKLLHRLDQGAHNGFQSWRAVTHTRTQTTQMMEEMLMPQVWIFGASTSTINYLILLKC